MNVSLFSISLSFYHSIILSSYHPIILSSYHSYHSFAVIVNVYFFSVFISAGFYIDLRHARRSPFFFFRQRSLCCPPGLGHLSGHY